MEMTITTKQHGRQAALFGLAACGIYLIMIYITLAHIEALSGLRPFDMRPSGYSVEHANSLLSALGFNGRRYYLMRQIPLDLAYPALMALTLISVLKWLGSRDVNRKLVQVGIWVSIGAAVADYLENIGICLMILQWSETSANVVMATSFASIIKSALTMTAVMAVLLGAVIWALKRLRSQSRVMPAEGPIGTYRFHRSGEKMG